MAVSRPSLRRLILGPALITLAITLLRLVGELSRWSPSLFNREPGGPGHDGAASGPKPRAPEGPDRRDVAAPERAAARVDLAPREVRRAEAAGA